MECFGQIILGAGVTAGFHPISYVKTLIQLGYEPLPPVPSTSIFGRKVLAYPGLFKYLRVIREKDGFCGMYRGVGSRLVGAVVGSFVTNAVSLQVHGKPFQKRPSPPASDELDGDEETVVEQLIIMVKDTCYETVARCSGVVISHPFHVIMVRQMAQFIGKETTYNNIFSSIAEIYEREGILGFFVGLVPRLCGEIFTIWLANALAHLLNNYLIPKSESANFMTSYTNVISSLMVTQVTYPFMLVSNVMIVNNSGLKAGQPPFSPIHQSWLDCWSYLARQNALKRGSSVFMRYYKGPVTFRRDGLMVPADY